MDPVEIRKKIGQFRALVIGRPNAGKTTILRCIARSTDGRVDPSSGRGVHNITKELVFSSNPGFVFHDSRGIESGTINEMETIQAFISERGNARNLREKLHAIWYCIPTDNARLVTAAEEQFFDKIDPNGVPVILIFTKFESQEAIAFQKLQKTCNFEDALALAPHQARQQFDQEHLYRFKDRRYPAKEVVYLKNMDGENADCSDILELTMSELSNDTLKWLLATVQEANIRLRIKVMLMSDNFKISLHDYIM
jgi:GTPase Era involved in 16S rRNA processing